MQTTGISLITNACSDDSLCHEEVLEVGKQRAVLLQSIVIKLVERIELEEIKHKIEQVCAKPASACPTAKPEVPLKSIQPLATKVDVNGNKVEETNPKSSANITPNDQKDH